MRLLWLLCVAMFSHHVIASEQEQTIMVTGLAAVSAQPDKMSFTISVEERGADPKSLDPIVSNKASQIVKLLKDAGVTDTNIHSMQMTLFPQHRYDKGQKVSTEYVLGRTIRVTHNDFSVYSQLLTAIIDAGATHVSQVNAFVSDPEQTYQRALNMAMKNAQEKAQKMLLTIGAKLGDVVAVNELSQPSPIKTMRLERIASADQNLNLPGESKSQAQVRVTFSIAK